MANIDPVLQILAKISPLERIFFVSTVVYIGELYIYNFDISSQWWPVKIVIYIWPILFLGILVLHIAGSIFVFLRERKLKPIPENIEEYNSTFKKNIRRKYNKSKSKTKAKK